jgi:hypothetical protein
MTNFPRFGTVKMACKMIGGDKPIHESTFYRNVAAGIYSGPVRVLPNVSRVNLDKLADEIRARTEAGEDAA